jgi:K+-sensing histidine kinase KdpD
MLYFCGSGTDEWLKVSLLEENTDRKLIQHLHSYFLANISHEFRTPLASLIASIEILLDEAGYLSPAEMGELLSSIQLSANGLQTLIDNLLASTTIEVGHFTIRPRRIEINQVIGETVRVMQPLLDRREQSLMLTQPLRLPEVSADAGRLTQVFINLLANASKYSPLGQTIDLDLEQKDRELVVSVADRGPGIPDEERLSIFQRFVRLDNEDREQYGAGLGLSVAKAIVEGHGGQINVEARPGGGSVFWFTIPIGEFA